MACQAHDSQRPDHLQVAVHPSVGPRDYRCDFSLYGFLVATNEQIQAWADEAEAGYDADLLKRRRRGRPGRGAEPMQVVAVRLTAAEIAALDAVAEREHLTRSETIRRAVSALSA